MNKLELGERKKHFWYKVIKNFEQFRKLVFQIQYPTNRCRDRLRGLYQIPDMYVDDTYIDYLEVIQLIIDETSKQKM